MKLTIIESPFAGDFSRNREYLKRAIHDSMNRKEIPFASHGLYGWFLDDSDLEQRERGMTLGYRFWNFAETIAFYTDYGMSPGMDRAYTLARQIAEKGNMLPTVDIRRIGQNA